MNKIIVILMCFNLMAAPVAFAQGTTAGGSTTASTSGGSLPDPGKKSYLDQILSIGTAVVGTSALLTCKTGAVIPSIQLFFAGSLVYVASEILGGKTHTEAERLKTEELKALEGKLKIGGDLQLATLEAQLKDEQALKAFANKRKMWLTAIMAIYAAATALATIEVATAPFTLVPPGWIGTCAPGAAVASTSAVQKAIVAAYAFGVGNAGGGVSPYAAMGAALAVSVTSLGTSMATAMNSPTGRLVFFGAAAGLTATLVAKMGATASKIQERITILEKLIAQFKEETKATNNVAEGASLTTAGTQSGNGATANNPTKSYNIKSLPLGSGLPKNCWTKGFDGKLTYSEKCSKPITLSKINFGTDNSIPTLKSIANLGTDFAQAVADGDAAKADVSASALEAMASRANEIKDEQLKKLNASRVASGQKPIDLNADSEAQLASMKASLSKDLASKGISEEALNKDMSEVSTDKRQSSQEISAGAEKTIEVPPTENLNLSESKIDDAAGVPLAELEADASAGDTAGNGEIAEDSDVSIFKQVSNRYFLNYNKIFERREPKKLP